MMKAEFTAIIEAAPEGSFWAICPEVLGANGQGETIDVPFGEWEKIPRL
jgi:predicted RNase H-like HicB family nuclease